MSKSKNKVPARYGIAELYGHDFARLQPKTIRELANAPSKSQLCPFRGHGFPCNKKGGVCSLRLYTFSNNTVIPVEDESPVTTCPNRFYDSAKVMTWVGETLINTKSPIILSELPFLKSDHSKNSASSTVGKIDMILVHPETEILQWCALEIQAVYFSGSSMSSDFNLMKSWEEDGIPFPQRIRRPDFRSSGPKRLMPQLQIKVPTISRWGRKMAVVVDLPFWQSLGNMTEVTDVSNCDIAWFVMQYEHDGNGFKLSPGRLHLTTLERAVEGLTGGRATSLAEFEDSLRIKLTKSIAEPAVTNLSHG